MGSIQNYGGGYDLIIDRASITHNNTISIRNAVKNVFNFLRPGGVYIGVDWFSTKHTDYFGGEGVDDNYTRRNHESGQFFGVGKIHFSDEPHLRDLFSQFEICFMEEKIVQRAEPKDGHQFSSWNLVCRKYP